MNTERIDLRGASTTLLWTLYLRARDARSARPILGDTYATGVLDRIDYDVRKLRLMAKETPTIAARARCLDVWTAQFLAEHPHGQVLHLGCGLDSRPLRVELPATARWIDVDLPDVMQLRRKLYDLPPAVELFSASATDPGWWADVDGDRSTLVVCEGLLMYLDGPEVHRLLDRAVRQLRSGRLIFDAVAPWSVGFSHLIPAFRRADTGFSWAYRRDEFDLHHPDLQRLDDRGVLDLAIGYTTNPALRAAYRPWTWLPPTRDAMRLHRFGFGA